jgi:hypothetical protein
MALLHNVREELIDVTEGILYDLDLSIYDIAQLSFHEKKISWPKASFIDSDGRHVLEVITFQLMGKAGYATTGYWKIWRHKRNWSVTYRYVH